jgi:ribonuclease-3
LPHRSASGTSLQRLGHHFVRPELLERALTHPSWAAEHDGQDYERLEFLGDAVIGLVVSEHLHESRPGSAEGELSRLKSSLVRTAALASAARDLDLGSMARFGRGALAGGDRERPSVLEALYEAVTAAIYLDGGLEAARAFVDRTLVSAGVVEEHAHVPAADAKSRLQEETQARGLGQPTYRITGEEGPAHERAFTAVVEVEGRPPASGTGHTKQAAQQAAASAALQDLAGPARPSRRARTR